MSIEIGQPASAEGVEWGRALHAAGTLLSQSPPLREASIAPLAIAELLDAHIDVLRAVVAAADAKAGIVPNETAGHALRRIREQAGVLQDEAAALLTSKLGREVSRSQIIIWEGTPAYYRPVVPVVALMEALAERSQRVT